MLIDDKPALNDELLVHFGVKGMKWGVRRKRPDEAERKAFFSSKHKKIAAGIGVAIAGGAAAIFILANRGKQRLPSVEELALLKGRRPGKGGASLIKKTFDTDPTSVSPFMRSIGPKNAPSFSVYQDRIKRAGLDGPNVHPAILQIRSGQIAHEQALARIGNQKLTEQAWRDSARFARLNRDMQQTTNSLLSGKKPFTPSLEEIRRHLEDPNHVWEI